jgi:hypothetical protein
MSGPPKRVKSSISVGYEANKFQILPRYHVYRHADGREKGLEFQPHLRHQVTITRFHDDRANPIADHFARHVRRLADGLGQIRDASSVGFDRGADEPQHVLRVDDRLGAR